MKHIYNNIYHPYSLQDHSFLISGGAGFIGSHLVEYLMLHGARQVKVLDNLLTGSRDNIEPFIKRKNFEFIHGDICDASTCQHACEGIDYVLHQAALGSVPRSIQQPERTHAINIDGFLNMLIAARDKNVKRFVYASSSSVYGDEPSLPKIESKTGSPLSPYAVTKKTNELYANVFAKVYNMEIIGMRYFNVFGPRQDPNGPYAAVIPLFINNIVNSLPIFIDGDGLQTRDFTFVGNVVQANVRAVFTQNPEALSQVYNVAVGENFSLLELIQKLETIIGLSADKVFRASREGDIKNSLASIEKAQTKLNYNPEYKISDGLKLTIDSFL